jgi:hypothetical protein
MVPDRFNVRSKRMPYKQRFILVIIVVIGAIKVKIVIRRR